MDNHINDYDYKPNFNFFKTGEEKENKDLFVGFELEVENKGNIIDPYDVTSEISQIVNKFDNQFIYYKHDGSLDEGVEIVSMPFTLKFIKENKDLIKEMMEFLTTNGYKSHDTTTCGLHFHLNRKYFGETIEEQNKSINKMILFTEYFKDNVRKLSRRQDYGYCEFLSDFCEEKGYYFDPEDFKNILKINKAASFGNKYTAINIINRKTVEIRFFRGTLNFESFMAAVEFVFSLAQVVKNKEITDISWDDVIDFEGNEYLKMYCLDRQVPTMSEKMKDYSLDYIKKQNKLKEEYLRRIESLKQQIYVILKRMFDKQNDYMTKLQKAMPKKFNSRINKVKFENKFDVMKTYYSFNSVLVKILVEDNNRAFLGNLSTLSENIYRFDYYKEIFLKKEMEEFKKINKEIKEIREIERKVDDSICV